MIYKFILWNLFALICLGLLGRLGVITQAFEADTTNLTVLIFVFFVVANVLTSMTAYWVHKLDVKVHPKKVIGKLEHDVLTVRHFSTTLLVLGLIGTVVGFIIALSGVDPSVVGDVTKIGPMVAALLQGMKTALYTTLWGSILGAIWMKTNYIIIRSKAAQILGRG